MKNKTLILQPISSNKSFATFRKIIPEKEHGFTLIELIVVIIIVGILATVGISQYSRMVEKGRTAEAKMIIGVIRKFVYEYYLTNGTLTGITYADLNIGAGSDQVPQYPNCRTTHYFSFYSNLASPTIDIQALRCTSGGKTPQYSTANHFIYLEITPSTGQETWGKVGLP